MPLNLTLVQRNVYGKLLLYPVSPHARTLAELLGASTLTPQQLELARRGLGANVVIQSPTAPQLDELLRSPS